MSKVKKILTASLLLLVLLFLLLTSLKFAGGGHLPAELVAWIPQWPVHQVVAPFLNPLAFWGLIGLAILTAVLLLVVLFYPKRYAEINLIQENGGSLLMKKSAIESYVAILAEESGYMKSASATVIPYKKRLKVKLAGDLAKAGSLGEQTSLLEKSIQHGLRQFFGMEQPTNFTVLVKDVASSKQSRPSRVE
ncbi:TPA: alkaline shock response membrane anchor protein AmaP [Streptococcus suis]